jgi:hypothetical protein
VQDGDKRPSLEIAFDVIARHLDQPQTKPGRGDKALRCTGALTGTAGNPWVVLGWVKWRRRHMMPRYRRPYWREIDTRLATGGFPSALRSPVRAAREPLGSEGRIAEVRPAVSFASVGAIGLMNGMLRNMRPMWGRLLAPANAEASEQPRSYLATVTRQCARAITSCETEPSTSRALVFSMPQQELLSNKNAAAVERLDPASAGRWISGLQRRPWKAVEETASVSPAE